MKFNRKKLVTIPLLLVAMSLLAFLIMRYPEAPYTGHGDPEVLSAVYNRWKIAYESRGGAEVVRISLNHSKALSHEPTTANGQAALNLFDGHFKVAVSGLSAKDNYEVWLLDNHADKTSDKAIRIGSLSAGSDRRELSTNLDPARLVGFTLDAVAVAKAGETPQTGGLLFGSPGLLQRIYYNDRVWPIARIGSAVDTKAKIATAPFEFLLPKMAQANDGDSELSAEEQLNDLIARGQKIFTQETFEGNGRTCSTCHRPDDNHTIDPAYIAKLPNNDPLFVAEYNPKLAELEKPDLIRQFGLFVANVDGFDRPAVMRSASHLLGLANSLQFESVGSEFAQDTNYFIDHNVVAQQEGTQTQAIGWSGDGAPDGGSLRDFAKGAIKQHLPKTLARVDNEDFRMPTEDELDALEAYMLSLGRSSDINLAAMTFKSPLVQKGKLLFDTKNNPKTAAGVPIFGTTANCNGCHMNAGAISSTTGGNPTRDTGVERMRDQLHHLADNSVAYDGGFGQTQQDDCGPDYNQTCYSDESLDPRGVRPANHPRLNRFNTPSLIEAADTAPFFHNNSVTTLEEAVAFYNTEAFNQSPGSLTSSGANRQVKLDSSQVVAVALFLRSINTLENIRSSNQLDQKAISFNGEYSKQALKLAMADTNDAIRVLTEAVINPYPQALAKLKQALEYESAAIRGFNFSNQRQKMLQKAIALKTEARALIVVGG